MMHGPTNIKWLISIYIYIYINTYVYIYIYASYHVFVPVLPSATSRTYGAGWQILESMRYSLRYVTLPQFTPRNNQYCRSPASSRFGQLNDSPNCVSV